MYVYKYAGINVDAIGFAQPPFVVFLPCVLRVYIYIYIYTHIHIQI